MFNGAVTVLGFEDKNTAVTDLIIKGTVEFDPEYFMWAVKNNAFENCNIETLTIEYYTTDHTKFVSEKYGPFTFELIGAQAFKNCKKLTSISLPYGLTRIDEQAFYGCESLESVSLPFCVERIGAEAFAECTALKEVHIDENVKTIDVGAFSNCAENLTVYLKCAPINVAEEIFSETSNVKLVIPEKLVGAYQNNEFWSKYEYEIMN